MTESDFPCLETFRIVGNAASDAIFLVDYESGTILDANPAACALFEYRGEELRNLHVSNIVSFDDQADVVDVLRNSEGQRISATMRPKNGSRTLVKLTPQFYSFDRDCLVITAKQSGQSDRMQVDQRISAANARTRGYHQIPLDTVQRIASSIIEIAESTLDLKSAAVYVYDEIGDLKRIDARQYSINASPFPSSIGTDGTSIYEEFSSDGPTQNNGHYLLPVGRQAVLILQCANGDTDSNQEAILDLFDAVTGVAITGFEHRGSPERAKQTEDLLDEYLSFVNHLYVRIRDLIRVILEAEDEETLKRAVCEQLVETEQVAFSWIGVVDRVRDQLVPEYSAGDGMDYLVLQDLMFSDGTPEPAVTAFETNEAVVYGPSDSIDAQWGSEMRRRGFESAVAIPLRYKRLALGVLVFYSTQNNQYDRLQRSMFEVIGEVIGHALMALTRKDGLVSPHLIEIDFEITDVACFFTRAAEASYASIHLSGLLLQEEGDILAILRVNETSSEAFVEYANASTIVREVRLLEKGDPTRIEVRFTGPFLASRLADYGIVLRQLRADGDDCIFTVAVPPTLDVPQAIDAVKSCYPSSQPVAKREMAVPHLGMNGEHLPLKLLTQRQRQVLSLAVASGYFDTPKQATGRELADQLDISHSTFHAHLRTAERLIFEHMFTADFDRVIE